MASFAEKLKTKEVPAKRVSYRANSLVFSEMDASYGMYLNASQI